MWLSLLVYFGIGLLLFLLGWHYNREVELNHQTPTTKQFLLSWQMMASFAIFTLITGLRYHTGWDHEYYIVDYVLYQKDGTIIRNDFEVGYTLIRAFFAKLGLHYSVFFSFWGFINIFFLYLALKDERKLIPWVGLFTTTGFFFLHIVNSLRQGVVECVFVFLVLLATKKKYLWYFVGALLLTTIHKVAFLIIPLFLFVKFPIRAKRSITPFAIYVICFVIGQFPIFSWLMTQLSSVLSLIGYEKYVDLFYNNSTYAFHRTNIGILTIIFISIHLILIYYWKELSEYFKQNQFFEICYSFSLIYICYFVLVLNTSFYFKRPCELLLPFFLFSTCYLTHYLLQKGKKLQFITFCLLNSLIACIVIFKEYFYYNMPDSINFYHFIPF